MTDSRFDAFTEHERAMLMFGLTLFVLEEFEGIVAGPMPPETQARDFPVISALVNEIGGAFGLPGLDPKLLALVQAKLEEEAAKAETA